MRSHYLRFRVGSSIGPELFSIVPRINRGEFLGVPAGCLMCDRATVAMGLPGRPIDPAEFEDEAGFRAACLSHVRSGSLCVEYALVERSQRWDVHDQAISETHARIVRVSYFDPFDYAGFFGLHDFPITP